MFYINEYYNFRMSNLVILKSWHFEYKAKLGKKLLISKYYVFKLQNGQFNFIYQNVLQLFFIFLNTVCVILSLA